MRRIPYFLLLFGCLHGDCDPSSDGDDPVFASLVAEPNPIQVCDGTGLGKTRIAWFREGFGTVELRVGDPGGKLFVRSAAYGDPETGKWVRDGMKLYLLDDSNGGILAELVLRISVSGCEDTG